MRNLKKDFVIFFLNMLLIATVFTSCKKDDDDNSQNLPPTGTTLKTVVTGVVTDENNLLVIGATVKLAGITTVSDDRGRFYFMNVYVPKDRLLVTASKQGYFNAVKGKKTQSAGVNYMDLVLESQPVASNISGTAGGIVNIQGASITFPANAFVDVAGNPYTGTVKVFARHLNTGESNFEAMIPGGDLQGINALGQPQSLYSMGMIEAELKDNSGLNEIKLAPGKTAELKFPIDASQSAMAQTTIPLWSLNNNGVWIEEGSATKVGNNFIGNVSHFSVWNCDYSGERCDIKGMVVDCQGLPLSGIVVKINNFMSVTTDNLGIYTTWVPVGYTITCQVLQSQNPQLILDSQVETIIALAGINTIPNLIVPCASRVMGSVKLCGGASNSPAFVYVSWNGGGTVQYCEAGNYNIYVPFETPLSITANINGIGGNTTKTSGVQGSVVTAPNILLCNTSNLIETSFRLTSGANSTKFLLSNTTKSSNFVDVNADGIFDYASIYINGTANPGNYNCSINISVQQMVNDYYSLNDGISNNVVSISMDSTWTYESGIPLNATLNRLRFTDYGAPGGVASGTFEFDASNANVTEGTFSVIRN